MDELISYMNDYNDDVHPLIKAAIVHSQFESIHPFSDGNGRVGRILVSLYLYKAKVINFPFFYSTYADMDLWRQLESVAKNRWVGAYWQSKGITVIPTVSWSNTRSFEFCFDSVEQENTVAVGMIGCKHSRLGFMRGYNAMLERLNPKKIIVFGDPFPEMEGNIIQVDYQSSRKVGRYYGRQRNLCSR